MTMRNAWVAASKVATGIIGLALVGPPHLLRAMHLIQGKLTGKDIPASLPTSLVPPSIRTNGAAASPFQTQQPQQSETIRDLLWDETPPPSAITPQSVQHQQTGSLHVSPSAFSTPFLSTQQAFAAAQDPFGSSTSKSSF